MVALVVIAFLVEGVPAAVLLALAGVVRRAGRFWGVGGGWVAGRGLRPRRSQGGGRVGEARGGEPGGRPAVVAFSTPSCAACHTAQRPALMALEERTGGRVRIVHVNAAERPQVA